MGFVVVTFMEFTMKQPCGLLCALEIFQSSSVLGMQLACLGFLNVICTVCLLNRQGLFLAKTGPLMV